MCGIAGLVRALDEGAVRRALRALAHRGPDGEGIHLDEAGVVLGHRRLAVIDPSDTGRQPMVSDSGDVAIVFNGEIYDHAALRRALGEGSFRGTSDTEVLLRGYERHGIDGLLARVDGMFAFAIWDRRRRELHLARDRFGKKPLYVARAGARFAFASTLPAILELLPDRPALDEESLVALLTTTYVPGPATMFRGVERIPPGTRWTVGMDGSVTRERFFEPRLGPFVRRDARELEDELERALEAAVARRLVADVPLGAFLSGGIDSSLVVAMMARSTSRVRTIAMGFDDPALDERPYARAVAEHLGTEHVELVLTADALSVVPEVVARSGEPLADHALLPTYLLAREAKRHLTVVLTGDGGDELFGGYEHLRAIALGRALRALPLDGLARLATRGPARLASRLALVASYARGDYVVDPTGARAFRGRLGELLAPDLAARVRPDAGDEAHRLAWARHAGLAAVDRAMNVDLVTLLPDAFLHKLDVATMASGVEARSPFLDTRLFELARGIPWTTKLGRGETKHPLRALARRLLPPAITERRKRGFSPPTGAWLMKDGGEATVRALLLSGGGLDHRYVRPEVVRRMLDEQAAGRAEHGQRLWALLVADTFLRLFVDRTLRPEDDLREFARDLA